MAKYGDIMLSGKSGAKYRFQSWPLRTRFRSIGAVFSVTKRQCLFENKTFHRANHEVIYIGQTANMSNPMGTLSQLDSFEKHGADCVCVYPAADEALRAQMVEDLIAAHQPLLNSSGSLVFMTAADKRAPDGQHTHQERTP